MKWKAKQRIFILLSFSLNLFLLLLISYIGEINGEWKTIYMKFSARDAVHAAHMLNITGVRRSDEQSN